MGQGEGQVLGQELLDVGALDVVGLLELNNTENLGFPVSFMRLLKTIALPIGGGGGNIRGWT